MDIQKTSENFQKELLGSKTFETLEQLRIKYLGRKGIINDLLKELKNLSLEEKKRIGILINKLKNDIESLLKNKELEILKKESTHQKIDVTLPGKKYPKGSLHPVTIAIEEISKIFDEIGFVRVSYPEVEWEYYAFESLNMPEGHPARDDFETFFINAPAYPQFGRMLLTPHTSSGQVREMKRVGKPPIRMINIAKCYRPNWSPVHISMFYQFEGLVVDKDINITHLKGTIDYFAKQFFGEKRNTRLRPFHFQFTEPSFEVDVTCGVCNGTGYIASTGGEGLRVPDSAQLQGLATSTGGKETFDRTRRQKCRLCKSGWLELGGAGMVHPYVLKQGGIDPEKYTGWAFGFGVERVFMMKEGLKLEDLRIMYSGNIRFLEQF